MKVINQTAWRTDLLRGILQRAAEIELEPSKRKKLVVTVTYTRTGDSSGCAYLGGRHATVRIHHPRSRRARYLHVPFDDPRPDCGTWRNPDGTSGKVVRDTTPFALSDARKREIVLKFASVASHEFAHLRGMDHDTMPANYKWHGRWREYVTWAADMPIEEQPPVVKVRKSVDDKLAHVLKMKALAETRVKRATTILKKWKQRERYYLKAAQKVAR